MSRNQASNGRTFNLCRMNDLPEEYDVYPKGIAIAKDRIE